MAYVLNNIRFRSVSSKSLERYYNVKSFVLAEMSDTRRQFSETARETTLLIFNSYSSWVLDVETLMLNSVEVSEDHLDTIFEKQDGLIYAYRKLMESHPSAFNPEFMTVWHRVHQSVLEFFRSQARTIVGLSAMMAYPLLIDTLIDTLRSTLYELYELDCLMGSDLVNKTITTNRCHTSNLLTYISDSDVRHFVTSGKFPLTERLAVYEEMILKPDIEIPIIVKNYTEASLALKEGKVVGENVSARLLNKLTERNPRIKIVEIIH